MQIGKLAVKLRLEKHEIAFHMFTQWSRMIWPVHNIVDHGDRAMIAFDLILRTSFNIWLRTHSLTRYGVNESEASKLVLGLQCTQHAWLLG